jgi:hypothetical protein
LRFGEFLPGCLKPTLKRRKLAVPLGRSLRQARYVTLNFGPLPFGVLQ